MSKQPRFVSKDCPLPWSALFYEDTHVDEYPPDEPEWWVTQAEGYPIQQVESLQSDTPESVAARAHLLAAAPELLKVVEELVYHHDEHLYEQGKVSRMEADSDFLGATLALAWKDGRAALEKATGSTTPACPGCGQPPAHWSTRCKECDERTTPAIVKRLPPRPARPTVVCLCGSTRFSDAFQSANLAETLAGHIVLTIGCDTKSDQGLGITPEQKAALDELHLRKIDMADEILVLDVDSYIGESTAREIEYARRNGKPVRYLSGKPTQQPYCNAQGCEQERAPDSYLCERHDARAEYLDDPRNWRAAEEARRETVGEVRARHLTK